MRPTFDDIEPFEDLLIRAHNEYTTTVSSASWALSLRTTAYAVWLCDLLDAQKACDLGSGFTSYALRTVVQDVTSVDDDDAWLHRTREFLVSQQHEDGHLVLWDDWLEACTIGIAVGAPAFGYDVIVHDFSIGPKREAAMWRAADALSPDGALIFDDAQHEGHRAEMHRVATHHGLTLHSLHDLTLDSIGRFAMVASRNPLVEGDGS
jgi:predicted O-methyltransferase YrrM